MQATGSPEADVRGNVRVFQFHSIGATAMRSMFRRPITLAALVAMGLLASSARADMTVTISEDGGPPQVFFTAGSPTTPGGVAAGAITVNTTDFRINFLGGTEAQTAVSEVTSAAVKITNLTGSTGHSLSMTFSGSGFTAPTAPPTVLGLSHIGGTGPVLLNSPSAALTFTSSVGPPVTLFTPQAITLVNGTSFSNDVSKSITSLNKPFTITETLSVTGLDGLNDNVNFAGSTTLVPSVPEPSSMALAALGGVGLIAYGLRRRKTPGA